MINTLSCPIPSNINPLSPNGFQFSIAKLPELVYFAQQVNLPEITITPPEQNTPFTSVAIPGDIMTFGELNVQFLVDENMANYKAIHNWMKGLGFPESYENYTDFINSSTSQVSELQKNYSDGTLQILGSNNKPVQTIQFVDLFPVSLQSLTFESTVSDVQYLMGNVTFKYTLYKFI